MALDWTSILTGGAGGLLGVIGNVANTILAMKQQKMNHEYELARLPLQLNADLERAKAQIAIEVEKGAGAAFAASQQADVVTGKESPWALNVRAMVRPVILFLLGVGTVAIYLGGDPTQDMKDYITQNIVVDFSMAISWYFGARASDKIMQGFKTKAR